MNPVLPGCFWNLNQAEKENKQFKGMEYGIWNMKNLKCYFGVEPISNNNIIS